MDTAGGEAEPVSRHLFKCKQRIHPGQVGSFGFKTPLGSFSHANAGFNKGGTLFPARLQARPVPLKSPTALDHSSCRTLEQHFPHFSWERAQHPAELRQATPFCFGEGMVPGPLCPNPKTSPAALGRCSGLHLEPGAASRGPLGEHRSRCLMAGDEQQSPGRAGGHQGRWKGGQVLLGAVRCGKLRGRAEADSCTVWQGSVPPLGCKPSPVPWDAGIPPCVPV